MSKPVDSSETSGAGRFWELYGNAGAGGPAHERGPAEPPPPESPPGPAADAPPNGHECLEWCPVCRGAEVLRAGAPPEIRGQLQAVQRDSLLMLRALIDNYLQRPPSPAPPEADGVEDIPIR